jgi:hypothetical protein
MNNVERSIVITAANNTAGLLNQLKPARNNMGVVEPVAVPMLEPPGRVLRFYFEKQSLNVFFIFL